VEFFEVMGFGPRGWGLSMLAAAGMTVVVSTAAFFIGMAIGTIGAWAKIGGGLVARGAADVYTTVLRGFPDLLVIYLFYFGGSTVLTAINRELGGSGFVSVPAFMVGALAVGVVSGAYQTEVFRGAYGAIARGEIEAARAVGMSGFLLLRRIVAPQVMRHALPGLGNCWQLVLKESALISVTGLVELLRQAQVGAGSTRLPFYFYITAAALYLALTTVSNRLFEGAETYTNRGVRRV
jgi:octopine/nopaline transport system permease protein